MSSAQNGYRRKKLNVAVVGGGLVGSLEALYLAKRGHHVQLYEYREDIRKTPQVRGRSINLALSVRGRRALRGVGLEEHMIKEHGIPMEGRMIHRLDGSTYSIPYDSKNNQCIYSVGRNYLNALLLKESEKYSNIEKHFNHKLVDANLVEGSIKFYNVKAKQDVEVTADLVVGADGAYSAVRKAMMKQPLFDYNQTYIPHGYLELCIPADQNGGMPPNYLHIWPRGAFMMIALPNQDCSWTVTLFLPFNNFKSIDTEEKLLNFFGTYFPDSISLIGRNKLIEDFLGGAPSSLLSVKCRPYHVGDKAVIVGDAAHAVVPFYGQGMNAGFEDCTLLDQLFQKHNDDLTRILAEYSETRWEDVYALSDLALYNYVEDRSVMKIGSCSSDDNRIIWYCRTDLMMEPEDMNWNFMMEYCIITVFGLVRKMRDLVTRPSFRIRKGIDDMLYWMLPDFWIPLYNSITFTSMPYAQCVKNRKWQDRVMMYIFVVAVFLPFFSFFLYRFL